MWATMAVAVLGLWMSDAGWAQTNPPPTTVTLHGMAAIPLIGSDSKVGALAPPNVTRRNCDLIGAAAPAAQAAVTAVSWAAVYAMSCV